MHHFYDIIISLQEYLLLLVLFISIFAEFSREYMQSETQPQAQINLSYNRKLILFLVPQYSKINGALEITQIT